MKTHKDLDVWKKGMDIVVAIYKLTEGFPKHEIYGLTSQIRRAAVSVPSNIAEGASRQTTKEYIQFLYIALGSLKEMETQLILASRLEYIEDEEYNKLIENTDSIGQMLVGLIKYLKRKLN